ncbi:MAG: flagellar hook-length control protein FliK [OM182 bacterium]
MNISSKYDLSDIVKELGSSNSVTASKSAGPEGVFSAILSDLAAAGITGKVAAEVAEAVESGARTPLSSPANDLLAQLKAMRGEEGAAKSEKVVVSNSAIAATNLLAELKELQGLRKENFERGSNKAEVSLTAAQASQSLIDRDIAATGKQGLIAFLQARIESANTSAQSEVQTSSAQSNSEKQSNAFASLLTSDALRITKLKDSRTVLLGPGVASKPEIGVTNRFESKFGSLLSQVGESTATQSRVETTTQRADKPKSDDSPEYWNRETARLLAEMGRGNGANEFIPDTVSTGAQRNEASTAAAVNAGVVAAQSAALNSSAAHNAETKISNTSALRSAIESKQADGNLQVQNIKKSDAAGNRLVAAATYDQAQRPARFDSTGLLGLTAIESQAMSGSNSQAIAQAKTETALASQQLAAQRGEHFAESAAPINAQLLEKAQQQRKGLTSSQEASAITSTAQAKSETNTAALKQQFANVVFNEISTQSGIANSSLQTNPLGTAFAPIANQTRPVRDTAPLVNEGDAEVTLQELKLGVSQGANAKANEAANQRVSIANLPQGIASRINPLLAKGLGSGPTKISISLFPENYGQIDVEFVYSEEAGLRVSLSSESAETTRLLQSNSSGLRESLLGNSLANVSVDVNAHGQGKQEGSAPNSQNAAASSQVASESATEAEPLKNKAASDNSDGLDTYV